VNKVLGLGRPTWNVLHCIVRIQTSWIHHQTRRIFTTATSAAAAANCAIAANERRFRKLQYKASL